MPLRFGLLLRVLGPLVAIALAVPGMSACASPNQNRPSTSAAADDEVDADHYLVSAEDPQGYRHYAFSSPDGGLRCSISRAEDSSPWGCRAANHRWEDPQLPAARYGSCEQRGEVRTKGVMVAERPGGRFVEMCGTGDIEGDSTAHPLPIGARITALGVTCRSTASGGVQQMRCAGPKGSALAMSTTAMTFTQPAG